MGIVNVTPDSFFDGGQHDAAEAGRRHCERLVAEGADLLDIGGESSRPGAAALPLEEELRRVLPVVRHAVGLGVPVSVDTYKPEVMRAVLDVGADIINDIHALARPGAVEAVAAHPSCGIVLMHMQGEPQSMQKAVRYASVVDEVEAYLRRRAAIAAEAGIDRSRLAVDPGIGFGKLVEHNFALLREQARLSEMGLPLVLGWSRKSSLGAVTGRPVEQRLAASLAAALACVIRGGHIVRVHDVAETVDALKIWDAAGLIPASHQQRQEQL